jgi:hypothetical protein
MADDKKKPKKGMPSKGNKKNPKKRGINEDHRSKIQPSGEMEPEATLGISEGDVLEISGKRGPVTVSPCLSRESNWKMVEDRRKKRRTNRPEIDDLPKKEPIVSNSKNNEKFPRQKVPSAIKRIENIKRRLPKSAVIAITKDSLGNMSYAAAVKKARD